MQFALDPFSFDYYVIEVNPACIPFLGAGVQGEPAIPIARVSAKIAVGMHAG